MILTDRIRDIMRRARSRKDSLANEYENGGWRAHHYDLSRFLLNRRGKYLAQKDYEPNDGFKINQDINNSTPEEAIHTASAGLMGGFTSPSIPWVNIIPQDQDLRDYKPAQEYLWRQQSFMYEVLNTSNWYTVLPQIYDEILAFGQGAMRIDIHDVKTIHCTQYTAGSYYLGNGSDGSLDTVCYRYPRTVRNLVDTYGIDNVTQKTRDSYNKKVPELDRWVKCANLIETNGKDRDRNFADWRGMRYRAITWEEDAGQEEPPLKMGGHNIFPVVAPRIGRRSEEIYGSSRGMRALTDARQIQSEERRASEALSKMINPPMNIPANLRRADLRAGGQNRYRGQRADAIRPSIDLNGFPYQAIMDTIARRERKLEDVLGASVFKQFQLLDETGNHNMTVPEVQERKSEKYQLLGPMQQSIHQELLQPAIEIIWNHMATLGRLEEPPPELAEMPLKIQFTSSLALEQLSAITDSIRRFGLVVGELNQYYPGASDNYDVDVAVGEMSQGWVLPPQLMRDQGAVDEIRNQRAIALEEERAMEQQANDAKAARDLGAAPLGGGTALDAVAAG